MLVEMTVPVVPEGAEGWREVVKGVNPDSGRRVSDVVNAGERVRVPLGTVLLAVNSFAVGYTCARTPLADPPRQELKQNAEVVIFIAERYWRDEWKEVFRRVYKTKETVGGVQVKKKLERILAQVARQKKEEADKRTARREAIRAQDELEEWVKRPFRVVSSETVFNKGLWRQFRADMSQVVLVDEAGDRKEVWRVTAWKGAGPREEVNYFAEKSDAQYHYRTYKFGMPSWWDARAGDGWSGE